MKLHSSCAGLVILLVWGPLPASSQEQRELPRAVPGPVTTDPPAAEVHRFRHKTDLIDDLPQELRDQARRISKSSLPATLDSALATALRSNPDLLSADIEVRKAEAALNQTRLKVAHEVSQAFREREILLEAAEKYQGLHDVGAAAEGISVQIKLWEARQALAKVEAQLRYLLGVGADAKSLPASRPEPAATVPARPSASVSQWDEQLGKLVEVEFMDTPLIDVATYLQDAAGIDFVLNEELSERKITLHLNRPMPLRSVLAAIADKERLGFVIRDYGILVTTANEASMMSPTIPEKIPGPGTGFF